MPSLSWNEIRQRAIQFSRDWKGATDERAEAQTFWNEFFDVFGIKRRTVAAFEEPVKSLKDTYKRIDLFWKGRLLAEHKSAGASLDKAESQAFQYIQDLAANRRNEEIPRYIVLCNFTRIALYDLEPEEQLELPLWEGAPYNRIEFPVEDLHGFIRHFAFLIGQQTHKLKEEDPANMKAAAIMAGLHDEVADSNYETAALERLLVRLLFCLFADDTGIFEPAQFELFLKNHTRPDGSDLGPQIRSLFEILDTAPEKRSRHLEEDIAAFPYINGELFKDRLPTPGFDRAMRDHLLVACMFDWSRISPAIFGSLFQGIMDPKERRQIGAHYTSETNILKLIQPLFLDELQAELQQIAADTRAGHRRSRLMAFQEKLAALKFLDPACGCGNFLVITYRELRRLETRTLQLLYDGFKGHDEIFASDQYAKLSLVDVHQFYGIEIEEWPSRIAETALWLTDHQMNTELSQATGNLFQRIPLRATPHILCANALRMDWNDLLPAKECSYVLGNPPFIGKNFQNSDQKKDMKKIAGHIKGYGLLDYVSLWYLKSSEYISHQNTQCAFVSTNSISQGEQVSILWNELLNRGLIINFAHRTFSWKSEAKGSAHVHVVIVGFARFHREVKFIYEYNSVSSEPTSIEAKCINPYLLDAPPFVIQSRSKHFLSVPPMINGSKPTDNGNLILTEDEKVEFLRDNPSASKFIRYFLGGAEFINGIHRWCIWLHGSSPNEYRHIQGIIVRVENTRKFRSESKDAQTRKDAERPYEFQKIRQPASNFLAIPRISSERRIYIPIGFMSPDIIVSDLLQTVPKATQYHFGVLSSSMHMAWVRQVCGRMKSDFRYSARLVYNNFPWPLDTTPKQREKVEECAQGVLDARQKYLDDGATLADLYDPLTMPADLLKAHQKLDNAVDKCYRSKKFENERERVEFLFEQYEIITSPLAMIEKKKTRRKRKNV